MRVASAPDEAARTAREGDLAVVVALAVAGAEEKREQKGGALWWRRERRQGDVAAGARAALEAADQELAVGTLDGAVIGYAVARWERLTDGSLLGVVDDIYVDPGARSVGVGEVLMDHVLAWCRDQGCFGVDSLALPGDRATKNFFESFGLVARAIVVHKPFT
ncbi:MAG TPA: GNAT family N-acetyltransferase [Acidimicrobiales bacterium]|nr:GNAT family N-acetyltransferase [Acidimicrobiales bacterium]